MNNVFFLGTAHAESFRSGGIELTPVMGRRYWPQRAVFRLVDRAYLVEQLANLPRGQQVARRLMGLKPSVRDAAQDKHRNWLLVYGGGSVAALAMDVELRQAGSSLPALMRALYAEFGVTHKPFTQEDVVRTAHRLAGVDLGPVLEPIVARATPPELAPLFARIGIELEQYGQMETYLLRRGGDDAAAQRFRDIFGMAF